MPRPKNGYVNAAGEPIPGTHDPISRFEDKNGLMRWKYQQGLAGRPEFERSAIDIGSTVHGMAELDLRGRSDREIEAYANDRLTVPDHLRKCWASFSAFRQWRQQCHVRAIAQEVPLVSEKYQYGGTPDTIAMIGNGLGLIDFKTSPRPYPANLVAMAAHGQLWHENNPQHQLTGYHLLILPKDGSPFQHHAYGDLSSQWKLFTLYLEAYRLDKACITALTQESVVAKGPKSRKPAAAKPVIVKTSDPPPVVRAKVRDALFDLVEDFRPATQRTAEGRYSEPTLFEARASLRSSVPSLTMAEMLRAYGHIKEHTL